MEDALKELNAKTYAMTIKKEEALNKWLDKQLQTGQHSLCFKQSKCNFNAKEIPILGVVVR